MDELSTLTEGRNLLRSIRNQRLWCIKHRKGYIESKWATTELNNLESAISTINTSDKMKRYLREKETTIRLLMPGNNKKRHEQLRELITE